MCQKNELAVKNSSNVHCAMGVFTANLLRCCRKKLSPTRSTVNAGWISSPLLFSASIASMDRLLCSDWLLRDWRCQWRTNQ